MSALSDHFPPISGRMHEAGGLGRYGFAACVSGALGGDQIWVSRRGQTEGLNPLGLVGITAPERLLLARTGSEADMLGTAEEALRSGAVTLVIIEATAAVSFTAGRRLQLAAGAGRAMALCLIPEGGACNAAQTRWICTPEPAGVRWDLVKNKSGALGTWLRPVTALAPGSMSCTSGAERDGV